MSMLSPDYVPDFTDCKLPYVQWYQDDFVGGVRGLRDKEIGIYVMLLMEMYARGEALAMCDERLARLCGSDARTFRKVLDTLIADGKIVKLDCGLWNERCDIAFRERAKMLERKKSAATASWENRSKINDPAVQVQSTSNAGAMLSSEAQNKKEEELRSSLSETVENRSDEPKSKRARKSYPADFEGAWSAYPTDPNMSKSEAFKAWSKLPPEERLKVAAGISGFVAYCRSHPDYRPIHMVGWINKRRFEGFLTGALGEAQPATMEDWERRLTWARDKRCWSSNEWGPAPGAEGCRVPPELLRPDDGDGWGEFRRAA